MMTNVCLPLFGVKANTIKYHFVPNEIQSCAFFASLCTNKAAILETVHTIVQHESQCANLTPLIRVELYASRTIPQSWFSSP
jgi:hypothetical protein